MIFKFLKVDMGEFHIGKHSNIVLKIKLRRCLKGRYSRATGIRVRNGRYYYLGKVEKGPKT